MRTLDSVDWSKLLPGANLNVTPHEGLTFKLEVTRTFNDEAAKNAVSRLLMAFGVNRSDENFKGTPARVVKMWKSWLEPKEVKFAVFQSDAEGAVTCTGHKAVSCCPHHLLPFELDVDVGYIPNGYVVGLSKLPRLVDVVASSFALQEHIPEAIVRILSVLLTPRGAICRVRSRHGCMRLRGVRTPSEVTVTAVAGVFHTDEKARNEFLSEAHYKQA